MSPLSDEELAYMRETQAEHRPTAATFDRRTTVRSKDGGMVDAWTGAEPIQVRLDAGKDSIPTALAEQYGLASLTKIVLDQARDIRSGDRVTVSPSEVYQVVTDGDPDRWATAQVVYGVRQTFPARA